MNEFEKGPTEKFLVLDKGKVATQVINKLTSKENFSFFKGKFYVSAFSLKSNRLRYSCRDRQVNTDIVI